MEQEKDYFNLKQVAEVCGTSVEAIKNQIFSLTPQLWPSYHIKNEIRANLDIEIPPLPDSEDYDPGSTERYASNVAFTGIVDIFPCPRNSGRFDGTIELHPNRQRKREGIDDYLMRPSLYHTNQSGERLSVELLDSCELSEDKLIIHRDRLKEFINNNHEAMQRYEQLSGTGVNAAMPEYLPPYLNEAHKHYAPELAALVKVWLELFEGRKYKNSLSPTVNIVKLLKEKGLSPTAAKAIARVAIPEPGKTGKTIKID